MRELSLAVLMLIGSYAGGVTSRQLWPQFQKTSYPFQWMWLSVRVLVVWLGMAGGFNNQCNNEAVRPKFTLSAQ
jgi:hypothetical protein